MTLGNLILSVTSNNTALNDVTGHNVHIMHVITSARNKADTCHE